MRSVVKVGAAGIVALLGAAGACATADDSGVESPVADEKLPPSEPTDAGGAPDAGEHTVDAGPCSDSGLCLVPAPIDTRINVVSIAGSGPNDVWAVGSSRTILHYDGTGWEKTEIPADAGQVTMRTVWLGGPADVWIADGLFIRHSTGWKGSATEWTSWMVATGDSNGLPTTISGTGGRVFIGRQVSRARPAAPFVTCTGMDGGEPVERADVTAHIFSQLDQGLTTGVPGVWSVAMTRPDEAWATKFASARVARVHREVDPDGGAADAGTSWIVEEHDSHSSKDILGVWGDEHVVWLVGEGGTLRRMTRERIPARLFDAVPSPATETLRGIHGFHTNDVWAVGDDATVLHWDGEAWTRLATPLDAEGAKPRLVSVWGSGPNDVWIGGNGVMMHFERTAP